MVLVFFFVGVAIAAAYSAVYYRRKWKKSSDRLIEINHRLHTTECESETKDESIKSLTEDLCAYKHLLTHGCRNLKIKRFFVPIGKDNSKNIVSVVGQDTRRPDLWFPIKTFHFNPQDPDDYDFAIREAEELIERIEEECLPWNYSKVF